MAERFQKHGGLDKRALTIFPLVLTLFCLVSGGPYGLEEGVGACGAGMALLLIVLVPIVWAAPVAMMTAELTSAIPQEGGYYAWTKRAFGPFWGFQCGWWTWLYSIADATLYPILFCDYLSELLKMGGHEGFASLPWLRPVVVVAIILFFCTINVLGTKLVGGASIVLGMLLISPFLALIAIGAWRYAHDPGPIVRSLLPPHTSFVTVLTGGLYVIMWNYLGWDNLSTAAEEVDQPERTFPKALFIAVPLVTLLYVLSVSAGLRFVPDMSAWSEHSWPAIASAVGGSGLGLATATAALFSALALFVTALLASSRIPFAMSEDRFFPKALSRVQPRFKTPAVAIVFCSAAYALLAILFRFQKLLEIDVTLYSAAVVIELLALVKLRRIEPKLPRTYRVPGGQLGVVLVACIPILVIAVAMGASIQQDWRGQIPVVCALASGPLYFVIARRLAPPIAP